jgi:hypothetical protein
MDGSFSNFWCSNINNWCYFVVIMIENNCRNNEIVGITVTVQLLTMILRQAKLGHGSFRSLYRSWDTTSRDATWERS